VGIGNPNDDQQASSNGVTDRHIEAHVLQLYHTWFVILLRTASTRMRVGKLDTVFDGHTSEFDDMLNFAEAIVKED
jgi:hypothetical protein